MAVDASAVRQPPGLIHSPGIMKAKSAATITSYRWEPVNLPAGVSMNQVNGLAVHPTDAAIAFLAASNGLYQTTDAGQSWTPVAASLFTYVNAVNFAPSNPQQVYLQSWGLYRSDNGGNTWTPIASSPSNCGLTVAPSDANRLYARSCGGTGEPAVYRSTDGGQTWNPPSVDFTQTLSFLAVSPANSDVLIASDFDQTFRSPDGGQHWTPISPIKRYFGYPVFDPLTPHTLYLGHWSGLLRSNDGGQTWQDSWVDTEFSILIASPFIEGEVLGGDDKSAWRIQSNGNAWKAVAWDAPLPLKALWRSVSGTQVIYESNGSGLWRYSQGDLPLTNPVFLPLVSFAVPDTFPAAAKAALDRANLYRQKVGVIPLRLHPAIVAATQNHANYFLLNFNDTSAMIYGAHGEVAGKPGFTGKWPSDRIVAAGFPYFGGSEVMHFLDDPVASVDGWMSTIYHRVILLDPGAHYTGYGNGRNSQTAVDVMDFGGGPTDTGVWMPEQPYPQAYPADQQTGVPTSWGGGEYPDPLPPGAARPVGYPFTLQGVGGTLQVTTIELRDAKGQLVNVYPNPTDCTSFNCYALIPVSPLKANATYTVHATGNVSGVNFDKTWVFTTGQSTAAPVLSPNPGMVIQPR